MMPLISFVKNKAILKNRESHLDQISQSRVAGLDVSVGTNLMQALLDAEIPVASSCHGDGICRKCVVTIIEGLDQLTAPSKIELELGKRNPLPAHRRLSCQAEVLGDVKIDTGYW